MRRLKAVPKHMDATSRYAAEGLYVFPRKESFPIGDLYHARMALVYALSPSLSAKRKKVVQAVASAYPEYNWASWWNSRRKKGVKTWKQLVGQSQAKKSKRKIANPRRRNSSSRTFTVIVKPYESGMSDETVTVKASTPQEAVNILQGRFDFGNIGLDASYHPHTVIDDKGKRYGVGIGEDDEYVVYEERKKTQLNPRKKSKNMAKTYKKLNSKEMKKLALKHNRSADKRKNYGFLVRKYGRSQASKITGYASIIAKERSMRLKSFGELGKEMRELGYTGYLSDYPTVKDRRSWIRGAASYRYDLNNPRKNSAHSKSSAQRIYFGPEASIMRAHEVMDVVEKCIKRPSVKVLHSNYVGGVLYVHLQSTKDFKEKIGKECVKKLNSKFPKNDIEVFFIDGDNTKKYTLAFRIKKLK